MRRPSIYLSVVEGPGMSFMLPFAGNLGLSAVARVSGTYMCLPCDVQFEHAAGHTSCPCCHTGERADLAALYVEHDSEEAEFVQAFDFGEGD